jgi:hypothetical protein
VFVTAEMRQDARAVEESELHDLHRFPTAPDGAPCPIRAQTLSVEAFTVRSEPGTTEATTAPTGAWAMDDRELIARITHLVAEEQRLQQTPEHDPEKLRDVEVTLDQLWDLLRQRRSQEEFVRNPEEAQPRDPKTVEGYIQ